MPRGGWRHLPAALMALVFLLPLFFMITGSLRKAGLPAAAHARARSPSPLAFDNYPRAFDLVDIPRYTLNSLDRGRVRRAADGARRLLGGFAMSRLLAALRPAASIAASLVALMVPLTALLVPRFVMFRHLGLINTVLAADRAGADRHVAVLRAALLLGLPAAAGELFEAARLEGLGPSRPGGVSRCRSSAR